MYPKSGAVTSWDAGRRRTQTTLRLLLDGGLEPAGSVFLSPLSNLFYFQWAKIRDRIGGKREALRILEVVRVVLPGTVVHQVWANAFHSLSS